MTPLRRPGGVAPLRAAQQAGPWPKRPLGRFVSASLRSAQDEDRRPSDARCSGWNRMTPGSERRNPSGVDVVSPEVPLLDSRRVWTTCLDGTLGPDVLER